MIDHLMMVLLIESSIVLFSGSVLLTFRSSASFLLYLCSDSFLASWVYLRLSRSFLVPSAQMRFSHFSQNGNILSYCKVKLHHILRCHLYNADSDPLCSFLALPCRSAIAYPHSFCFFVLMFCFVL